MKKTTFFTFFLLTVAAGISVVFVNALKPSSTRAWVVFSLWLVSPYVMMAAGLAFAHIKQVARPGWHGVAVMVSIGGILFLADVIFWHPDAQGAIAVMMTPLLQAGAAAILLVLASLLSRLSRRR